MIRSAQRFSSTVNQLGKELPPLSKAQRAFLDRVIRVDQAGELGANYIYHGQYIALSHKEPHLKPLIKHMWDQEIHHHNTFNNLQTAHRVRPSLLTPLWKLGAMTLGVSTGLLGKEGAMACTEAVETVIGNHYNEQLRVLMNQYQDVLGDASPELCSLKKEISQFRDEELEHLNTAVENDSHQARPYWLLTETIKATCRVAVWTAERF